MKAHHFALLVSVVLSGLAAVGCSDADDSADVGASDDELQARAKQFVGEFTWDPQSTFTDFQKLYLNDNGSYQAEVESSLVNPNVRCAVFPCTQPEMGHWTTTKVNGRLKIAFSPAGKKPSRSYFATIDDGTLSLTRNNVTTELKAPKVDPAACVVSGCSSEICADSAMMSPCIVKPEFACYKKTKCERQTDGQCGWTKTKAVEACLAKIPGQNDLDAPQ